MNEVTKIIEYALAYIQNNKGLDKIYKNIQKSDSVVYKHSYRVAQIAVALGLTYRFNLAELIDIAVGAFLHDCGKVFLNNDILYKSNKLDSDEKLMIEAHTNLGYKLVKEESVSGIVLDIVKGHHEKLTGKGYPDGLNLKTISIYVQIVTIADIYEALTSTRCYHQAKSSEETLKIMAEDEGLNQTAVGILKELVKDIPY